VHVQSGEVEIQIYEAHPEPVKPKPWFAIFCRTELPGEDSIRTGQHHLRFRGERAGFFGTQLLITPNGRDFEYVATGGRLKWRGSRSRSSPHARPDHENALTLMIWISHPIHAATKAFELRDTQASARIKASM